MSCSRTSKPLPGKGAQLLSDLILTGKFPKFPPLAIIPGDVESDPAHHDDECNQQEVCELVPSELKFYKGMRLCGMRGKCTGRKMKTRTCSLCVCLTME